MRHVLKTALRARNVDVVLSLEARMIERTDEEHLKHATTHGRVLYSFTVGTLPVPYAISI